MLRRLLLASLCLTIGAAILGVVDHRGNDWLHPSYDGLYASLWLLYCPLTAVAVIALLGRARASDCEFGERGFKVIGGARDKLSVAYRAIRIEGTELIKGRLYIDLGDGIRIHLASAEVARERSSLEAFLSTLRFRYFESMANESVADLHGYGECVATAVQCSNCGCPAIVDDLPQVVCKACGTAVSIDDFIRDKIRVSRTLNRKQRAARALIQKALNQPSAKHINQCLLTLSALGIVWLPVPAVVLSATVTAASVVVFSGICWYSYALIANRKALAVLVAECGARPLRDGYGCCNCGAPLPVSRDLEVVCQCVYCDTDNVLGFDVFRERRDADVTRTTVVQAHEQHRREIMRAQLIAVAAILLTGGAFWAAMAQGMLSP
jgi:hypothetical protein